MAAFLENKRKYRKRFGLEPGNAGTENRGRGTHPTRRRTEFGLRLEEKQRLKFLYGIRERQLERYAHEAFRRPGDPRQHLLGMLETRLDTAVHRLGLSATRQQARQLVSHRHVLLNNRKISIPSATVRPGDTIRLSTKAQAFLKNSASGTKEMLPAPLPQWLKRDEKPWSGTVLRLPTQEELPQDIDMQRVIEFLSRKTKKGQRLERRSSMSFKS